MTRTFDLPVTSRGRMRLSPRLRETYLTPAEENGHCITQAVGTRVFVWVPSERQSIRLALPIDGFDARRPYQQKVHRWGISINRYLSDDATGTSVVTSDAEKPTVEAAVGTVDATPEVVLDA